MGRNHRDERQEEWATELRSQNRDYAEREGSHEYRCYGSAEQWRNEQIIEAESMRAKRVSRATIRSFLKQRVYWDDTRIDYFLRNHEGEE
jgi:hypothetical protein